VAHNRRFMTLTGSPIEAAREAFSKHAWRDAYARFTEADAAATLGAEDLRAYAETAWWCGEAAKCIEVGERAFHAFHALGDKQGAARCAMELAFDERNRGSEAIAKAWLARAERLLRDDHDTAAYAHLLVVRAFLGLSDDPMRDASDALALAERTHDLNAQALSLMLQGQLKLEIGDVQEGMALIDEATVAAVSGELGLKTTGLVYCATISACRDISDYRRASDWTDAAKRWCERSSVTGFPGICRVHRAEVIALRGALASAEQEARLACDELHRFQISVVEAEGFYEIGKIRLRMGDLPAAEEAFRQAHEMGHHGEPGLSLIRLAEGKAQAAHASLQRLLAEGPSRTTRARILPAAVEVAIAAGDVPAARAAADELMDIAKAFGTPAMEATAHVARASVLLAEGDAEAACRDARVALAHWTQLDAPYEAARARMVLAQAARAAGDTETAHLELAAAKATFVRIGARRDAAIAAEALGDTEAAPAIDEERVVKTFLFTDIVKSTQLVSVIGDDAWTDLIRWHDDALRAVIAEHRGEEIRHQGDGFAVAFATPVQALDCAIAIQRRLADHRAQAGFAPSVRIGLHASDATRVGADFSGKGVHEAARIAALGGAGEIVASAATVGETHRTSNRRSATLKGLSEPIEVANVDWR